MQNNLENYSQISLEDKIKFWNEKILENEKEACKNTTRPLYTWSLPNKYKEKLNFIEIFGQKKGKDILMYFVYYIRTGMDFDDFIDTFSNPSVQTYINNMDETEFQELFTNIDKDIEIIQYKAAFNKGVRDGLTFRPIRKVTKQLVYRILGFIREYPKSG